MEVETRINKQADLYHLVETALLELQEAAAIVNRLHPPPDEVSVLYQKLQEIIERKMKEEESGDAN